MHKSPHHGLSVEFAEHKPYNQGDEFRHIDWKVYGKTERFYIRQYAGETNLRAYLLLDISHSMDFRYHADWSKLRYGIHLAAALIHLLHRQRDAFGLITFDEEIQTRYPARSTAHHQQLLYGELEKLLASESERSDHPRRSASADVFHQLADSIEKRSMVIVLSDLFENVNEQSELISGLKHLRKNRHEVLLLNLLEHQSERLFDFPDGPVRFEDMETGAEVEVSPAQLRAVYRERMEEHLGRLRSACSEYSIDLEEVDTRQPFEKTLLSWLVKRKRIR
ncbi:MAG: DUF58 domain-containing protein [Balneolaceae bacterium]